MGELFQNGFKISRKRNLKEGIDMHISTKFDFHKIPSHGAFSVRLMVNIEAESTSDRISKPLNLALVLDRSGSMSGSGYNMLRRL